MSSFGLIAELTEYRAGKSILVVDQHKQLGGQWNDAYDYVALHHYTWTYTVQGYPWPPEIAADRAHQATKAQLLTYFKTIEKDFLAKGVEIHYGHEMTAKELIPGKDGEYKVTLRKYEAADDIGSSKEGGATFDISAKKLIMCTHTRHNSPPFRKIMTEASGKPVPNNIYPYQIGAQMIPQVKTIIAQKQKIAVIGGGKTGVDAMMHLHWTHGVPLDQFVWIKKHDLAYALRVPPAIEADLEGRNATFFALMACWYRGGLNSRLTVCTSKGGPSLEYGQPRAPIMATTGGGVLGHEELAALRQIEQHISGLKTNAPGKLTLENGEVIAADWVLWCHGYDVAQRHASVPRGTMEYFLFDKGCYIPMNFFAGAATGGRPLGRAFLLWEDGLMPWPKTDKEWYYNCFTYYYAWIWWMLFWLVGKVGGAGNSSTWFIKGSMMERVFLHGILYRIGKNTRYKEFGETSLSKEQLFWPKRFRSISEFFMIW